MYTGDKRERKEEWKLKVKWVLNLSAGGMANKKDVAISPKISHYVEELLIGGIERKWWSLEILKRGTNIWQMENLIGLYLQFIIFTLCSSQQPT